MNISLQIMTRLRSTLLRRAVAAVFLLAMGFAHASPLIKPQSIELLCSAGGAMKLLVKSSDGTAQESTYTVHCSLCALGDGAAPPANAPAFLLPTAIPSKPLALTSALAALSLPPLPARGPPALS
jgi:hypothetical protein